jgi:D-3-phosphoglycerate dehydrogenase
MMRVNRNIILTPHIGASTVESEHRAGLMATKALSAYLNYGVIENSKNFPTVDDMPRTGIRMRLAIPHRNVPDMIGKITHTLGQQKINIGPMHNDTKGDLGYMVVDLEQPATVEQIDPIRTLEHVLPTMRVLTF